MSELRRNKDCLSCQFFEQGKNSSFCGHEKATESEKSYRYYNFSCDVNIDKYKEGISDSRLEFMGITREQWDRRDKSMDKKINL